MRHNLSSELAASLRKTCNFPAPLGFEFCSDGAHNSQVELKFWKFPNVILRTKLPERNSSKNKVQGNAEMLQRYLIHVD